MGHGMERNWEGSKIAKILPRLRRPHFSNSAPKVLAFSTSWLTTVLRRFGYERVKGQKTLTVRSAECELQNF